MKISLNWLNRYVDVSAFFKRPERLAELLTGVGLEVEEIDNKIEQFNHVVVGQILKKEAHPNADKLTFCQVSTGQGIVHQIVCGAQNHNEGDRVVLALPGAVLPDGVRIKKSKIRGVESAGMMCSEAELDFSNESDGIMILPKEAPIGRSFGEYAGLNDIVLELRVTPNRADCLSHLGLAREIAVLTDQKIQYPSMDFSSVSASTQDIVDLEVNDIERCPRYCGRYIKGVKIGKSPDWLRLALESVGFNSINTVVDITNFVMLELGQPLHAFDMNYLSGGVIKVDTAQKGESFVSLDGTEFELTGEELMIRDGEKAVALAGVVGGINSGVRDDTTDLFIESAYFLPTVVRKSSRLHGIETDSGYRFSRGVDPQGTLNAMNRACALIQELAGGEVYSEPYDYYPEPIKNTSVLMSVQDVSDRLGYEVSSDRFISYMTRLGCEVKKISDVECELLPPLYRVDLKIKEDFIEEYGRLNGYESIPESFPSVNSYPTPHTLEFIMGQAFEKFLSAIGYQQVVNLAFLKEDFQKNILEGTESLNRFIHLFHDSVKVLNPLSEDHGVLRTSLIPGLLQNLSYNSRQGNKCGGQFEIGYVFEKTDAKFIEEWRLGIVKWGEGTSPWLRGADLIYEVKSDIESLLGSIQGKKWHWENIRDPLGIFHSGQAASLFYEGQYIGVLGTLHPRWRRAFKIKEGAVMGELNLNKLMRGQPRRSRFKSISKFPSIVRDVAFVIPKELSSFDIVRVLMKEARGVLCAVDIFDVYEGKGLEEGMKSVAYRLTYHDVKKTLSDNEVNQLHEKIIAVVQKKLGVGIR